MNSAFRASVLLAVCSDMILVLDFLDATSCIMTERSFAVGRYSHAHGFLNSLVL